MSNGMMAVNQLVDQIPDEMKRLVSFIARGFYGPEYDVNFDNAESVAAIVATFAGIIIDLIKRNTCISEDRLKELTKFDGKQMRQLLATLKGDKLLKERQVAEPRPVESAAVGGKLPRSNYYFINYRAVLNVTKYKFDHMRHKLESREKNEAQRASYKCSGCQQHYAVIEIDKLYDPITQEMKCWRCNEVVEEDVKAGPVQDNRSLLAAFNEQMAPLFSMLRDLDGIQLSPSALEPTEAIELEVERARLAKLAKSGESADKSDPSAAVARSRGGTFNYDTLYNPNALTVNISSDTTDAARAKEAAKKAVPDWLRDTQSSTTAHPPNALTLTSPTTADGLLSPNGGRQDDLVSTLLEHEEEEIKSPPHTAIAIASPAMKTEPITEDTAGFVMDPSSSSSVPADSAAVIKPEVTEKESDDDEEEEEEEITVTVQGEKFSLERVMADPALVERMTDEERDTYVLLCQDVMSQHYH